MTRAQLTNQILKQNKGRLFISKNRLRQVLGKSNAFINFLVEDLQKVDTESGYFVEDIAEKLMERRQT